MKRKLLVILLFVFVASIFLSAASPPVATKVRITLLNRTWDKVSVRFKSPNDNYYFTVKSGNSMVYSIRPNRYYKATFWGCDQKISMKMRIERPIRMAITCNKTKFKGEPPWIIKIKMAGNE